MTFPFMTMNPMLLNLTGKSGSYYDIKPTDGSIVIKVYDTN